MITLEEAKTITGFEFPELQFTDLFAEPGGFLDDEDNDQDVVAWKVKSPSDRLYFFYPVAELFGQNIHCLLSVYLAAKESGAGLLIRFNSRVYKFELIDIYESKPTVKPFEGRNAIWFSIKLGKNISKLLHPSMNK